MIEISMSVLERKQGWRSRGTLDIGPLKKLIFKICNVFIIKFKAKHVSFKKSCVYMCAHTCTCPHVYRYCEYLYGCQRAILSVFFNCCLPYLLRWSLSQNLEFTDASRLASKPHGPSCLHLPQAGMTDRHLWLRCSVCLCVCLFLMWLEIRIQTRVVMLTQHALCWLRHRHGKAAKGLSAQSCELSPPSTSSKQDYRSRSTHATHTWPAGKCPRTSDLLQALLQRWVSVDRQVRGLFRLQNVQNNDDKTRPTALNHLEVSTLSFCVLGFSRILHDLQSGSCNISWPPKLWDVEGTHICQHPHLPINTSMVRPFLTADKQMGHMPYPGHTTETICQKIKQRYRFWNAISGGARTFLAQCYWSWEYWEYRVWSQEALDSELISCPCFRSLMQPLSSVLSSSVALKYSEVSEEFGEDQRWCKVPSIVLTTCESLINPLT